MKLVMLLVLALTAATVALDRPGLTITFRGWCYALNDYWRAFEEAGLFVERLREPTHTLEDPRHDRVPLFLNLRAFKSA